MKVLIALMLTLGAQVIIHFSSEKVNCIHSVLPTLYNNNNYVCFPDIVSLCL